MSHPLIPDHLAWISEDARRTTHVFLGETPRASLLGKAHAALAAVGIITRGTEKTPKHCF